MRSFLITIILLFGYSAFGQKMDSLSNVHIIVKGDWKKEEMGKDGVVIQYYEIKVSDLLRMDTLKLDSDTLKICEFTFEPLMNGGEKFWTIKSSILTEELKENELKYKPKQVWFGQIYATSNSRRKYFIKNGVMLIVSH